MSVRNTKKIKRRVNRKNKLKKSSLKVKVYKKINLHEFPIMATMSSGKSTLINALIGDDLLPNENQACTSKIFKIIDIDGVKKNRIKVVKDDSCEYIELDSLNTLNTDKSIKEVIIEGDFKGISNKVIGNELHQMCIIDTPGPNNSLESSHAEIAYKFLEDNSDTHLIYVLNGTQIGVNDDKKLLIDILDKQKKISDNNEIIFVLNKMDEIDQETECILTIIQNVKNYLSDIGIKQPKVIPVSAYAAKLFKLALNGKLVTRKEKNDFKKYYSYFEDFKISDLKPKNKISYMEEKVYVGIDKFISKEIEERLYATGIIDLENELINSLDKRIEKVS